MSRSLFPLDCEQKLLLQQLFPEVGGVKVEGTLLAVVLLLFEGKPSVSMVAITVASCWFWKSWWLSEKQIGVCTVHVTEEVGELGLAVLFLELGWPFGQTHSSEQMRLGCFGNSLDVEDAEGLDGGG